MMASLRLKASLLGGALVALAMSASASTCVNAANPLESPVSGVEVFYNIHLPAREITSPYGDSVQTSVTSAGRPFQEAVPEAVVNVSYGLSPDAPGRTFEMTWLYDIEVNGPRFMGKTGKPVDVLAKTGLRGIITESSDGRPPFVWPNHVDPRAFDQKKLPPTGGAIYFYEPHGSGRRLCRVEYWLNRTIAFDTSQDPPKVMKREKPLTMPSLPEQMRNPVLGALSREYVMAGYANLVYSPEGQVAKLGPVCFYYKKDGQVRWVGYDTPDGRCTDAKPDPTNEEYIEVLFDAQGKGTGAILNEPTRGAKGRLIDKGAWTQYWKFRQSGDITVAYVGEQGGVLALDAGGKGTFGALDDNHYNRPYPDKNEDFWMNSGEIFRHYEFPRRVSAEILKNPETLYQHERIRVTGDPLTVELYEHFAAGSNKLIHRVWCTAVGNLARHEFFKDGRLVRAIATDFVKQKKGVPHWLENLEQYKPQLKVPFENVYLRVYDYDETGKESLVAIGWTDYPRDKYYETLSGSKRGLIMEMKDTAGKLVGRKVPERPVVLTYKFGTPDGKVKWASWPEMQKALFGTLLPERSVRFLFPEGRRSGVRV